MYVCHIYIHTCIYVYIHRALILISLTMKEIAPQRMAMRTSATAPHIDHSYTRLSTYTYVYKYVYVHIYIYVHTYAYIYKAYNIRLYTFI